MTGDWGGVLSLIKRAQIALWQLVKHADDCCLQGTLNIAAGHAENRAAVVMVELSQGCCLGRCTVGVAE